MECSLEREVEKERMCMSTWTIRAVMQRVEQNLDLGVAESTYTPIMLCQGDGQLARPVRRLI